MVRNSKHEFGIGQVAEFNRPGAAHKLGLPSPFEEKSGQTWDAAVGVDEDPRYAMLAQKQSP